MGVTTKIPAATQTLLRLNRMARAAVRDGKSVPEALKYAAERLGYTEIGDGLWRSPRRRHVKMVPGEVLMPDGPAGFERP